MDESHRNKIVGALADEAIERDKKKGMIIDNLAGFRAYKVARIEAQAKEDPNWLIQQGDRMFGATQTPLGFNTCERCGAPLQPIVTFEYNGKDYCDITCAEGTNHVISLREHMLRLKVGGPKTCERHDGTEFTVTYEQMAKLHPRLALQLEAEDEF